MEAGKLPATPDPHTASWRTGSPRAAGGLIGFGLMVRFVEPVVLAVAYTVLSAWVAEQDAVPVAAAL